MKNEFTKHCRKLTTNIIAKQIERICNQFARLAVIMLQKIERVLRKIYDTRCKMRID